MYTLHIGNKNYSSWSARPWLLLRALDIPFTEAFHRFDFPSGNAAFKAFSPTAKVPCLVDNDTTVWDSLAIAEYIAERHAGVWPADAKARAWARCATAEMHSGFGALRNHCGMNIGVRVQLAPLPPAVAADIVRIDALWSDGLARFGGPWLAGATFTAVDAFFGPVAFRWQTYGFSLGEAATAYARRLLAHPAMREWEAAGLAEDFRDPPHDAELANAGVLTADLRAPAGG